MPKDVSHIPWSQLGEAVYEMVSKGLTKTPEFAALVSYYGRERLLAEYEKEKKRREPEEPVQA